MSPEHPLDLRVHMTPDAPVTPAWSALWRKLLAPVPAGDLPGIADALDTALTRAEPDAAGQQDERRDPCPQEGGAQTPAVVNHKEQSRPARHQDSRAIAAWQGGAPDAASFARLHKAPLHKPADQQNEHRLGGCQAGGGAGTPGNHAKAARAHDSTPRPQGEEGVTDGTA